MAPRKGGVAATIETFVSQLIADAPVRVEFWDGSVLGPDDVKGTVRVTSPNALRRMLWAPNELGPGRAYVAGEIDAEGDIFTLIELLKPAGTHLQSTTRAIPAALRAALKLRLVGPPPKPPAEEARVGGLRHSKARDALAISHHYDVGNDFYEIVLGPAMTYSCARFTDPKMNLAEAQESKHDVACRKLGLSEQPDLRVLDVGCGWGSLAIHAAKNYGARVVGITISREQAAWARERVAAAGVADQVEIRLQDYRELGGESFDAIASVGMFEHVGAARLREYFAVLKSSLSDHGRLLNHAISAVGDSPIKKNSFVGRYVFPDGELIDVGRVVLAMEEAGFEVRDVESLREHYALTLRAWVANLESQWSRAVELVGDARARVWRLYMAASAIGFEDGGLGLHQVLGVVADADGGSGMPRTRDVWVKR